MRKSLILPVVSELDDIFVETFKNYKITKTKTNESNNNKTIFKNHRTTTKGTA